MRLFIDNQAADTDAGTDISISLGIASFSRIETSMVGYSKSIKIPMTAANRAIMGDIEQINSPAKFNGAEHTARIEAQGSVVMDGTIYLLSCNPSGISGNEGGYYNLAILGAGKEWVKYASGLPLRRIPLNFSETITAAMIRESWSWDKPVSFFPVQRDKFAVVNTSSNLFAPAKILTFEDYHPFLHVRTLLDEIFRNAGYVISSGFIESEYFGKLYMSGNYPEKDTGILRERMDFKAGRFAPAETTADNSGRIYTSPYRGVNSTGNIVDTADPNENRDGETVSGVFSNGNYFSKDDERVVFSPPHEVTMCFEYSIFYTTGYYMESRDRLRGIDSVYLGDGKTRTYPLINRNSDKKDKMRNGMSYTVIVFDHVDGNSYQLRYEDVASGGSVTVKTAATFSTRSSGITITGSNTVGNPQIWIRTSGAGSYILYNGDWAVYNGYVQEQGIIEVELCVRSSAERILPSQPKYFNGIEFGGADPGTAFILKKETVVRPVFAEYPSEGTTVSFEQVAAHDTNCLTLINAFKQMFNLKFYTDHLSKTVYIEPHDMFYKEDTTIDWSSRIDLSKPVTVVEPGNDIAQTIVFQYQGGDATISRHNTANGEIFGQWEAANGNKLGSEGSSNYVNPLFTASLNSAGDFPDAPSAQLLQAGDRDASSAEKNESLNFPPKIVRYEGMTPLTHGEHWGWPSSGTSYPLVAFHYKNGGEEEENFTLCFEDRDDITGLHNYWDHNISLINESKKVELYIHLLPKDVEAIVYPNSSKKDFRALFRLTIDGEHALYRLEQICDYNPARAGSTKCIFIKEN